MKEKKPLEIDYELRIIGGEEVTDDNYLFMAGLFINQRLACGGTLISPKVVLSAAHCGMTRLNQPLTIDFVTIGCRDTDFNTKVNNCHRIDVQSVMIHPQYEPSTNVFDIMLIFLTEEAPITPVSLFSSILSQGRPAKTLGWGRTGPTDVTGSDVLLETTVDLVSREYCNSQYRVGLSSIQGTPIDEIPTSVVDETMICAARPGNDACEGDSGGPLLFTCSESSDIYQIGVVSFGIGCAVEGFPGVYSNLQHQFISNFIQSSLEQIGETNKGFETSEYSNCTLANENNEILPTMYPTFPSDWTCDISFFNADDGCDCNCGVQDPDCEKPSQDLYNCPLDLTSCIDGLCTSTSILSSSETKQVIIISLLALVFAIILSCLAYICYSNKKKSRLSIKEYKKKRKTKISKVFNAYKVTKSSPPSQLTAAELAINQRFDL